jgi:glutathione S-transferase
MLTLYHCAAARSFRPLWTLEELGLPYDLKMLPFPPRLLAKEYLGLNPLGTIPLLLDGGTRMTESAAISQYLATRYGPTPLAVGVNEPDFGAYLNWLHFGEATLTFPQTLVLRYTLNRKNGAIRKWRPITRNGFSAGSVDWKRPSPQVIRSAAAALRWPISRSDMRCCSRKISV